MAQINIKNTDVPVTPIADHTGFSIDTDLRPYIVDDEGNIYYLSGSAAGTVKRQGYAYAASNTFTLDFAPTDIIAVSLNGQVLANDGISYTLAGSDITISYDLETDDFIQVIYVTGSVGGTAISSAEAQAAIDNTLTLQKDESGGISANDTATLNLSTVDELSSLPRDSRTRAYINDLDRGGSFSYVASGLTVDDGIVFAATGGGFWVRNYEGDLNAKWFGAVGDGTTNDTAAIQQTIDVAATLESSVYLPEGTYRAEGITIPTSGNIIISGAGRGRGTDGRSIIQSVTGATVFVFSSGGYRNISWRDITISGTGSGSGHGIHFQSGLSSNPFGIYLENVVIENHGGKGFFDEKGLFESSFNRVMTSNMGGDHIDLIGGPTILFQDCRIWKLNAGTIGYRVRSGTGPTFINCNGTFLDLAETGVEMIRLGDTSRVHGTVIGCNFEDVNGIAIRCLNGSVVDLLGATTFRPQSITDYVAVLQEGPTSSISYGIISPVVTFANPTTGNYKNSQPLHSTLSVFRFWSIHKSVKTFYNDTAGASLPIEGPLTFLEMDEIADPVAPSADKGRLYIRDSGGTSELRIRFQNNARPLMRDVPRQTYTTSSVTTTRSFNANATTLEELADVLGTLLADLKNDGIVG